jgi:chemotaxis methyl-accepting protein methylase
MTSKALTVGKKQFAEISTILNNRTSRDKLQGFIDEVIISKTAVLDANNHIKSIREAAVDTLNIEPKMFNSLVSVFFNNNFDQKREELEKMEIALSLLMQTNSDD